LTLAESQQTRVSSADASAKNVSDNGDAIDDKKTSTMKIGRADMASPILAAEFMAHNRSAFK
jgi:hypothetical protein